MSVTSTCPKWRESSHGDGRDEPGHGGPIWGDIPGMQRDDLDVPVVGGAIEAGALRLDLDARRSANLSPVQSPQPRRTLLGPRGPPPGGNSAAGCRRFFPRRRGRWRATQSDLVAGRKTLEMGNVAVPLVRRVCVPVLEPFLQLALFPNLVRRKPVARHAHFRREIGIRPENVLEAAKAGRGETARLKGTVEIVEPIGHEAIVHARAGNDMLVSAFDSHSMPHGGDVVELGVELDAPPPFGARADDAT